MFSLVGIREENGAVADHLRDLHNHPFLIVPVLFLRQRFNLHVQHSDGTLVDSVLLRQHLRLGFGVFAVRRALRFNKTRRLGSLEGNYQTCSIK